MFVGLLKLLRASYFHLNLYFISYKNVGHGVVFKKSGRLCFLSDYGVSLIFNEKMANIIKSANKKYSQKRIFRKHVKLLPVSFLNKLLNQ